MEFAIRMQGQGVMAAAVTASTEQLKYLHCCTITQVHKNATSTTEVQLWKCHIQPGKRGSVAVEYLLMLLFRIETDFLQV